MRRFVASIFVFLILLPLMVVDSFACINPTLWIAPLNYYNAALAKTEAAYKDEIIRNIMESVIPSSEWDYMTDMVEDVLDDIPVRFLESFYEDGWHIDCDSLMAEYPEFDWAAGLTTYTAKTIYLNHCSSFTVYHELGHYIANELGLHDEVVDYLYDQDWHFNYALREYLRPYAGTNPREFFADCFADYVTSITQRERLEELAPLTYWVLENMVFGNATLEDFWEMAVNYDGNDLVVVTVDFMPPGCLPA